MDLGSHSEIVDPVNSRPGCVTVVNQIVLQSPDGICRSVRLYPQMTADVLRKRVAAAGITNVARVWLRCDDEALWDQFANLLCTVWRESPLERLESIPAGTHSVLTRIASRVTSAYFRAVAKIGFHYYLVHNLRGLRGSEPEFAPIRGFIFSGGEPGRFVATGAQRPGERIGVQLPTRTKRSCHMLVADETERVVTAYVCLFKGPSAVGLLYRVRIADIDSRIIIAAPPRGHMYERYDQQSAVGSCGRVRPLFSTRGGSFG